MYSPTPISGGFSGFLLSSPVSRITPICILIASVISLRLCGGIFVAMPTAIPSLPLSNRFGIPAGNTDGSFSESSKLGWKSTVFFSISARRLFANLSRRLSVYLIAAGGSPSILPKFPCPSTRGYRKLKSCAIRTMVS